MNKNKKTFERFSEKMGNPVSLNDADWKSINKKINKKFFFKWRPTSFNIYYLSILMLSTTTFSYYFYSKNNQENKVTEGIKYDSFPLITSVNETDEDLTNWQQNIKNTSSSINKELNDLGEKTKSKKTEITEDFNIKNNPSQNTNKKIDNNQYNSKNKEQNEVNLSIEENTHTKSNNNLNNKKESETGLGINDTSFKQNLPSDLKTDISLTKGNSITQKNNLIDSVNFNANDHSIDSMDISKADTSQVIPDSSIHKPVVIHRRDTIFNYDSTKVPRFKKKKFGL